MLSRFVIAFLPRSKHLLISWLQSPSAVILEPKKIKSANISTFPLSICHEVIGPDAMILVFFSLSNSLVVQWFGICGLDPAVGWVWSLVWELRLKNLQATRRGPPTPHLISLIWLEHGMKLGSWGDRSAPRLQGWGIWLGLTGNEGPRTGDTAGLQKPPWDGHAGKGSVGKCPDPTQTRTRGCVLRRGQDVPRSPGPQGFVGVRPVQGEHQALVMRVGTVPHSPTISPAEPLAYQSLSIYQVCRRRGLPSSPTFGFRRGAARGQ